MNTRHTQRVTAPTQPARRTRIPPAIMMAALDPAMQALSITYRYPTLTKITGKPTAVTLKIFQKEIYANAQCVPSQEGGGQYGHLGYYLPRAAYRDLPGILIPGTPGRAAVLGREATTDDDGNEVPAVLAQPAVDAVPDRWRDWIPPTDPGNLPTHAAGTNSVHQRFGLV